MAERKRFKQEMAVLLGRYFSDTDQILLANPRNLGQIAEENVILHEGIHRLLVHGTLFGVFEQFVVLALPRAERIAARGIVTDLRAVIARMLGVTCITHEAAACYVELCRCAEDIVEDTGDVEEYLKTFSPDLASAVAQLIEVLDLPYWYSPLQAYKWLAAVCLAKLALNGPVLQEFADPTRLTPESFERFAGAEAPDTRFQLLCSALKQKGGLAFLVPSLSEILTATWQKVLDVPPRFYKLPNGYEMLDLRAIGGLSSHAGTLVVEHAEYDVMRSLAASVPGLTVFIGAEEMEQVASPFVSAWSGYPSDPQEKAPSPPPTVVVTPPGDPRHVSRDRAYSIRFKLEDPGQSVTLDEVREFLTRQAADGRMTLAGFLETVSGGVAVFAAAFAGLDRTKWVGASALVPGTTLVASMDVLQVLDFALLTWEMEPYTVHTAWHLPLEVAHKMGFPNVGLGLHGTLFRSWATCAPEGTISIAQEAAKRGNRVHVRSVDWSEGGGSKMVFDLDTFQAKVIDHGSKAIVLQIFDDQLPWLDRLPCSPSYISWLGTAADLGHVRSELASEPRITWGGPAHGDEPGLLRALLDVAYNLKEFLGPAFPVELVPVENPYLGPR